MAKQDVVLDLAEKVCGFAVGGPLGHAVACPVARALVEGILARSVKPGKVFSSVKLADVAKEMFGDPPPESPDDEQQYVRDADPTRMPALPPGVPWWFSAAAYAPEAIGAATIVGGMARHVIGAGGRVFNVEERRRMRSGSRSTSWYYPGEPG